MLPELVQFDALLRWARGGPLALGSAGIAFLLAVARGLDCVPETTKPSEIVQTPRFWAIYPDRVQRNLEGLCAPRFLYQIAIPSLSQ